jgi:Uma2 family endonuclease
MGETEVHVQCLVESREVLRNYFRDDSLVYVGANLMLYYEEGDIHQSVSPDVFVTRGVPKLPRRRTYLTWREGKPPDFVLEISSRKTRREDRVVKRALYESLRIPELVLFDPLAEYLKPPLQGYVLHRGAYRRMPEEEGGAVRSTELGLVLRPEGTRLRFVDPRTGEALLVPEEVEERRVAAEAARREAEAARQEAEAARLAAEERAAAMAAENARLRAALERLGGPE